jgi:5-hydroxyisourate hydrolase-like protein (transthyretin family)
MSAQPRPSWYYPWAPIGLGVLLTAGVIGLILVGPPGQQNSAAAASPAPQSPVGFQTTDKLVLSVTLPAADKAREAALRVELLDSDGKVVASDERNVKPGDAASTHRFEFPSPKQPADQLTLRCSFGKEQVETPLAKVLLVKAHETTLGGGAEFFAGAPAALRCEVHGVKSYTETVPLADAAVTIQFVDKDGKAHPAYQGKTAADGVADATLAVPALPDGAYKLVVVTKSDLGEEKLERDVTVKAAPKVLLVSDKPLYQPGQLMHLRALALQSFNLKPEAGAELTFEVEDARGNKVFKKAQTTSEFGVAAADFQLADEVNAGDYHVRALLGKYTADKTVVVKPYVLPKFKADVTADKKFYLPKEVIHADLQSDYFFGKPVARAKVHVTASTFDVAFKDFLTWDGTTDADGHVKFDVQLPDYFVGTPLAKGDALVKVEVKITDTADHTETITKTYPVSDQAIRVSLLPEGGRLTPGLENRVFAAALYPDGSPAAKCEVNLWQGQKADGKPFASLTTNDAGLAEFLITPKAEQFRAGEWEQRNVELLGGKVQPVGAPKSLFDLFAEAKDAKGEQAHTAFALSCEPLGENVLLRLDKAVYKGGESVHIDARSSAGLPTVYLDVVKGGQTLLTKWLDVRDGRAEYKLDLPSAIFGTVEIHAYQMLASGEIIRDARVVYVQPAADLKIDVQADKDVYAPGATGKITFRVTDADGKPTAAALGVLVVDEAVYALQEMQPGLEKVYFTLQEELLKPQAHVLYKPGETVETLVRQPELDAAKQQTAQALLSGVRPKPPARWDVNPVADRKQKLREQVRQIGWALYNYAQNKKEFMAQDKETKAWAFKPDLLKEMVEAKQLDANLLTDPMGGKLTLDGLAKTEKGFSADHLGRWAAQQRMWQLYWTVVNYTNAADKQAKWLKDGKWDLPESVLADAAKAQGLDAMYLADPWGTPFKLVKLDKKRDNPPGGATQFAEYDIVSAGPDGKFGGGDDVKLAGQNNPWFYAQVWWTDDADDARLLGARLEGAAILALDRRRVFEEQLFEREMAKGGKDKDGGFPRGGVGGGPPPPAAPGAGVPRPDDAKKDGTGHGAQNGQGGGTPPARTREYFPETLFWHPALITDDKGRAELPLSFADSITTWRLTASASSKGGALGGTTAPLRVFQDFFVDLDLPVALTQHDEVAFPVAVYNYLKAPQTVTLDLQKEDWFVLCDGQGYTRAVDLKPSEVTSVKFRIRADKIGRFPLTVKAAGTHASDAVKRQIDVAPDGKPVEQVVTDRLAGKVVQTIIIPDNAVPDASKLIVKVYPGVQSQILEGAEGLIRLPGG